MGYLNDLVEDVTKFESLKSVPTIGTVKAGEYDLKISSASVRPSKRAGTELPGDAKNILVVLSIMGEPTAERILHYLPLPNSDIEEAEGTRRLNAIRDFAAAFDIEADFTVVEGDQEDVLQIPEWINAVSEYYVKHEVENFRGVPGNSLGYHIKSQAVEQE